MNNDLAIVMQLPIDWSEDMATILAERLVKDELPPGLVVQIADFDSQGELSTVRHEWATK